MTDTYAEAMPADEDDGHECVCGGCGSVPVDTDYVNRQMALKVSRCGEANVDPGYRAALENSVMPCYQCRPSQYEAWRSGSFGKPSAAHMARRGPRRTSRSRRADA